MKLLLAAALAALVAAPCAAIGEGDEDGAVPMMQPSGGLLIFYDSTGPMSFPSMTPRDLPAGARALGLVRGEACQRGVSIPTAVDIRATDVSGVLGDGGYAKALSAIKKSFPEVSGIYDVMTDARVFSILGVFKSTCTIVTARGFALSKKS